MFKREFEENFQVKVNYDEVFKKGVDTLSTVMARMHMRQTGMYFNQENIVRYEGDEETLGLRSYYCGEFIKDGEFLGDEQVYYYLTICRDEFYVDDEIEVDSIDLYETWNYGEHKGYCIIDGDKKALSRTEIDAYTFDNYFEEFGILPKPVPTKLLEVLNIDSGLDVVAYFLRKAGYTYRGKLKDKLHKYNGECYHFVNFKTCEGIKLIVQEDVLKLEIYNGYERIEYVDFDSPSGIADEKILRTFERYGLCTNLRTRFNILHFLYSEGGMSLAKEHPDVFMTVMNELLSFGDYSLTEEGDINDMHYYMYASNDKYSAIEMFKDEETGAMAVNFLDAMGGHDHVTYLDNTYWYNSEEGSMCKLDDF